ncbi:hypothetical protein B1F79_04670 [Coxiella-like endosymbiont of Rhipicephalus sanguineus]|nr:hypothetical protein [Coxiella-like endosymbiont of Rhipicephalus sanguineus]
MVYFGGTLFKYLYIHDQIEQHAFWLHRLEVDCIEVSDGTISIPLKEKLVFIEKFLKSFKFLAEIGSKDPEIVVAPYKWLQEIKGTFNSGAYKIVTEGRESGTVEVSRTSGEIQKELLIEKNITSYSTLIVLFLRLPKSTTNLVYLKSLVKMLI